MTHYEIIQYEDKARQMQEDLKGFYARERRRERIKLLWDNTLFIVAVLFLAGAVWELLKVL